MTTTTDPSLATPATSVSILRKWNASAACCRAGVLRLRRFAPSLRTTEGLRLEGLEDVLELRLHDGDTIDGHGGSCGWLPPSRRLRKVGGRSYSKRGRGATGWAGRSGAIASAHPEQDPPSEHEPRPDGQEPQGEDGAGPAARAAPGRPAALRGRRSRLPSACPAPAKRREEAHGALLLVGAANRDGEVFPVADRYDICIIDCPPTIGLLTFNALRAAHEVLVPVETGYFSMRGAEKQRATLEMLARRAHHPVTLRVLPTLHEADDRLSDQILATLKRAFGAMVIPAAIRRSTELREAASFGQPVCEYAPGSDAATQFRELAEWLLAHRPAQATAHEATRRSDPVLSRAAELLERARALSARSEARNPPRHAPAPPEPATPADAVAQGAAESMAETEPPSPAIRDRLARMFGCRQTAQGTLFMQPIGESADIRLAGDFNDWSPTQTPMRRRDDLGVWQSVLPLAPGRYAYQLVVDGRRIADPYNPLTETDAHGQRRSIAEVTPAHDAAPRPTPQPEPAAASSRLGSALTAIEAARS